MEKLDSLVTTHLADRLFRPQRLKALLAGLQAATVDEHFRLVEQEALKGDEWPRRLYRLVEDGAVRGGPKTASPLWIMATPASSAARNRPFWPMAPPSPRFALLYADGAPYRMKLRTPM